jgi:hypothetical protein
VCGIYPELSQHPATNAWIRLQVPREEGEPATGPVIVVASAGASTPIPGDVASSERSQWVDTGHWIGPHFVYLKRHGGW